MDSQIAIAPRTTLTAELPRDGMCRILSLDGGGAKGFYTLGVLKEIEAMMGCALYKRFDLVFGTSTGVSPHESGEPSPRAAGYEAPNVLATLIRPVPSGLPGIQPV